MVFPFLLASGEYQHHLPLLLSEKNATATNANDDFDLDGTCCHADCGDVAMTSARGAKEAVAGVVAYGTVGYNVAVSGVVAA
mmetsp:Transcript_21359/g.31699  ORF Transcript_21359/g.31699 Transcript_21359/m.31699 type:complete len:82 (-) Transcript_21359:700-945(-)